MNRYFHIFTTALLVAIHAVAVPLHITTEHHACPVEAQHDESEHHGACHAQEHHAHADGDSCAPAELFCDCKSSPLHHHDEHEHSITDHGFTRNRVEVLPVPLLALALQPLASAFAHAPAATQRLAPGNLSPPEPPSSGTPTLRGPPVC